MKKTSDNNSVDDWQYDAFSNNCIQYLIDIAFIFRRLLMEKLKHAGFGDLKMSHGDVIPLIHPDGSRIHDLAFINCFSKHALRPISNALLKKRYLTQCI